MLKIQSVFRIQSVKNIVVKMSIINETQSAAQYHKVTHVIMDMDGLLLDTEKIYEKIIGDLAHSYGEEFPWDVRMRILGTTELRTSEIAVKELDLPCTVASFQKQFRQGSMVELKHVLMMSGAERLIRHLHKHNVPISVATSSPKEAFIVKVSSHQELFDLFNHVVCGTGDPEVTQGKPSPDIFLVAAKRFQGNPKPENCLVFEDAPNGCSAAKSAGMQVVMVPDSHCTEEERKDATIVIKSLLNFRPEEFGLPPFPVHTKKE